MISKENSGAGRKKAAPCAFFCFSQFAQPVLVRRGAQILNLLSSPARKPLCPLLRFRRPAQLSQPPSRETQRFLGSRVASGCGPNCREAALSLDPSVQQRSLFQIQTKIESGKTRIILPLYPFVPTPFHYFDGYFFRFLPSGHPCAVSTGFINLKWPWRH